MQITINQITPRREDGQIVAITVHFTARTADGLINLSGSVPVITEHIDFTEIENEVKQELIEKIMNGEVGTE